MMSTGSCLISRHSSADDNKVERPLLDSSILGRFVRKCRLEYIKLDFGATGDLWNLFKAFRAPSSADWHVDSRVKHTHNLPDLHGPETFSATSIGTLPYILAHPQCASPRMTLKIYVNSKSSDLKVSTCHHTLINRTRESNQSRSSWSPSPDAIHFVRASLFTFHQVSLQPTKLTIRFRDAIGTGDYYSAVGHLHSCFDHTITLQTSSTEPTYSSIVLNNV
jgi:hypothetical protein